MGSSVPLRTDTPTARIRIVLLVDSCSSFPSPRLSRSCSQKSFDVESGSGPCPVCSWLLLRSLYLHLPLALSTHLMTWEMVMPLEQEFFEGSVRFSFTGEVPSVSRGMKQAPH